MIYSRSWSVRCVKYFALQVPRHLAEVATSLHRGEHRHQQQGYHPLRSLMWRHALMRGSFLFQFYFKNRAIFVWCSHRVKYRAFPPLPCFAVADRCCNNHFPSSLLPSWPLFSCTWVVGDKVPGNSVEFFCAVLKRLICWGTIIVVFFVKSCWNNCSCKLWHVPEDKGDICCTRYDLPGIWYLRGSISSLHDIYSDISILSIPQLLCIFVNGFTIRSGNRRYSTH